MAGELAKTGIPSVASIPLTSTDQIPNCLSLNGLEAGDAVEIVAGAPGAGYSVIVEKATTRVDGWAPKDCPAGEAGAILRPGVRMRYGTGVVPGTLYYLDAGVAGGVNTTAAGNPIAIGLAHGVLQTV